MDPARNIVTRQGACARLIKGPKEEWDAFYRRYQRSLAETSLIPLLVQWGVRLPGASVLEVGCGDGGCGAALAVAGARVTMIDIDPRLVDLARSFNEREGIDAEVLVADVADKEAAFLARGPFDLVVFRDVIEHLSAPVPALRIVRGALGRGGLVFVSFPPYYSPYGAHQQLLPRKTIGWIPYNRLPYLQLLPSPLFETITAGDGPMHREVDRLRRIRLTIGRFERSALEAGFEVVKRMFYVSRPSFGLRWGLPVIRAGIVGRVPLLREVLVTEATYLLSPRSPAKRESASASRSGIGMP